MIESLQPGDLIYAARPIFNDGSMPGVEEGALLAAEGQRGVIINFGHLEAEPNRTLILVRFENGLSSHGLGPAVACWPDELTMAEPVTH